MSSDDVTPDEQVVGELTVGGESIPVALSGDSLPDGEVGVPEIGASMEQVQTPPDMDFVAADADTRAGSVIGVQDQADSKLRNDRDADFGLITDPQVRRLQKQGVDYTNRVAEWLLANDDLIPTVKARLKGLITGQDGITVAPADPDDDADQRLADHLSEVYDDTPPEQVIDDILDENIKYARAVLRASDLAPLDLSKLDYLRDGVTGEEIYRQDRHSVYSFDLEDDNDGRVRVDLNTQTVDTQALVIGEHVFDISIYTEPPLKAVADTVVNKLVMQKMKARKAELTSYGGLYITVDPPAYLPEDQYFDRVQDADAEDPEERPTKIERAMEQNLQNAFDHLKDFQNGTTMSVPENWSVEQIDVPEPDTPLDEQIRGYNQAIARRLLIPLDLIELESGSELSRQSIFRTLMTTIAGWRREIVRVFDQFAATHAEIEGLPDAEVKHTFPPLFDQDESKILKALQYAGIGGLSEAEVRTMLNTIEGIDLETDTEPDPPSGPGSGDDPERGDRMREFLEEQRRGPDTDGSDDDAGDEQPDGETDDAAAEQACAYTPPEGLDLNDLDGWDQSSVWDAYLSVGASFTSCVQEMTSELRDPEGFCAALKDEALGTDLWRGAGSAVETGGDRSTLQGARIEAFDVDTSASLSELADTISEVIESNSDQDVTELQTDDDFVALSVGGIDPTEDDDTTGFQPVVIVNTGDGYQVTGIGRDNDLLDGMDDELPSAEASLAAAEMDVDAVYDEFQDTVNMTAAEVREWADHPCADTASQDPDAVRGRVIDVLETDKSDWDQDTAQKASKVNGFVSRMADGANEPDDVNDGPNGCPSAWAVSLMNWGFRPPEVSIPDPSSVDVQAAAGSPFADVPVIDTGTTRITRADLERLAQWKLTRLAERDDTQVEASTLSLLADWNPSLHPRGPDGQFVERPYDVPDFDGGSISDTDTHRLVEFLGDTDGSPDMDAVLSDEEIRIDGIPDDVNDVEELKARMDDPARVEDLPSNPKPPAEVSAGDRIKTPGGTYHVTEPASGDGPLEGRPLDSDGDIEEIPVGQFRRNTVDVISDDVRDETITSALRSGMPPLGEIDPSGPQVGEIVDVDTGGNPKSAVGLKDVVRVETDDGETVMGRVSYSGGGIGEVDLPDGSTVTVGGEFEGTITGKYRHPSNTALSTDDFVTEGDVRTVDVLEAAEAKGRGAARSDVDQPQFTSDEPITGNMVANKEIPEGAFIAVETEDGGPGSVFEVTGYEERVSGRAMITQSQFGSRRSFAEERVENRTYRPAQPRAKTELNIDEWPDDRDERERIVKDLFRQTIPKAGEHDDAEEKPIDQATYDKIADQTAKELAKAKDTALVETTLSNLKYVGDSQQRAACSNDFEAFGGGNRSAFFVSQDDDVSTITHELGHAVGDSMGIKAGSNDKDGRTYPMPSFDFANGEGRNNEDPLVRYGVSPSAGHPDFEPDKRNRLQEPFMSDGKREEIDAEIPTGLNGRNFSSPEGLDDIQEGRMIRVADRMLYDESPNFAVTGVVEQDTTSLLTDRKAQVTLESRTGDTFTAEVEDTDGELSIVIEGGNVGSATGQEIEGKRNSVPDDWGPADWPDADDELGERDPSGPRERRDQFAQAVNAAWYRQAKAASEVGEDQAAPLSLRDGYSAKEGHETISRVHELHREDSISEDERIELAETLVSYHPELLDAYSNLYEIDDDMKDIYNRVLERKNQDFRFDIDGSVDANPDRERAVSNVVGD